MSSKAAKELTEATNKFALELYQALRNSSDNIIVSPISLQIVLALAHQGAKGKTADEIAKVLHLPADNEKVLEGHKALIGDLEDPVLKVATRMFVEKSLKLVPNFQEVATKYFLSEVQGEDFKGNPKTARLDINNWAEEKTNNKIKDLLPEDAIDTFTRLVLVNAVHFKANWKKQFDKNRTVDMPFYVTPENTVNVKMMVLTNEKFRFMESQKLDAKILEVPYEGNNFSMIIILPNKVDGLAEVEDKLHGLDFSEELSGLRETTVHFYLPKFKLEETMDLNDILAKMGMPTSFKPGAEFSGISAEENLVISKVLQKAFIEVNEEGTEAAAASAMVFATKSAVVRHFKEVVKCDHPFGLFILHRSSKTAFFASRILKPPADASTPLDEEQ